MLNRLMSVSLLLIGSGLFNTFVSLRLEMDGYSTESIGVLTSALYGGVLAGSWKGSRLVQKLGHLRSFALFSILLGFLVMIQALWIHPWFWGGMRFLGGICIAGICIVIESWILLKTVQNRRGMALSLYLIASYLSITCGQLIFSCIPQDSLLPYSIPAFLMFLSLISLAFWKTEEPSNPEEAPKAPVSISGLGLLGSALGGATLASTYGLVPLYAKQIGLPIPHIGYLMAVVLFGGLCLQGPMGYWSDRSNRRMLLASVGLLLSCSAFIIAYLGATHLKILSFPLWFFGGFSCALYPISLAYSCDGISKPQVVTATGKLVLSYGIGAIFGPLIAPFAMRVFGPCGLFYFFGCVALLFGLRALFYKESLLLSKETVTAPDKKNL